MSPEIQTYVALAIVAVAVIGLGRHFFGKRKKPGCGGDCGCSANDLKSKLKP